MLFAYIAGYFDGEGCVTIGSNNYTVVCIITNTYPHTLNEIKDLFGGRTKPCKRTNTKWRNAYRFSIYGKCACDMLEKLIPFLKEKQPQAKLALEFYGTKDKAKKAQIQQQLKDLKHINH